MIAVDPRKEERFVVLAERGLPEEQQTIFILKPLTLREEGLVRDLSFAKDLMSGEYRFSMAQRDSVALALGLRTVLNLVGSDGKEVKFVRKNIPGALGINEFPDEILQRIPYAYRNEVAEHIVSSFQLAGIQQLKNLPSSPSGGVERSENLSTNAQNQEATTPGDATQMQSTENGLSLAPSALDRGVVLADDPDQ